MKKIIFVVFLLLLSVSAYANEISVDMYPSYQQTLIPIPLDQPWGHVNLAVSNNVAYFEVSIYNSIIPSFQTGHEPAVRYFWFNYANQINRGDIHFDSLLPWYVNPVDGTAGDRGNFSYQMFVGYNLGVMVLTFQIYNLPDGVTEQDFFKTTEFQGRDTEFMIHVGNDIYSSPEGTTSGMYLLNRLPSPAEPPPEPNPNAPIPEPSTMLLLGLGLACATIARKKFQK